MNGETFVDNPQILENVFVWVLLDHHMIRRTNDASSVPLTGYLVQPSGVCSCLVRTSWSSACSGRQLRHRCTHQYIRTSCHSMWLYDCEFLHRRPPSHSVSQRLLGDGNQHLQGQVICCLASHDPQVCSSRRELWQLMRI